MSKPKVKPTSLPFRCERPPAGGAGPPSRAYGSDFLKMDDNDFGEDQ
jgi:hypothetical protein